MTDHTYQSTFRGQGIQNQGSGNVTVGRDFRIETSKNNCLADLFLTDPRHDKKRIEQTKGGLLRDSYCWVLNHEDFLRWRDDEGGRLLWIKGDPGKGKTMLLCGIIDELEKQTANTDQIISFFFFQATDTRLNSAIAALRGLIYLLVDKQPSLISHIQERYDRAGKGLFEGVNAWFSLHGIFESILQDPKLPNTILVVDALDECETGLPLLLELIANWPVQSRVKWIISSRNRRDIEEELSITTSYVRLLCLELNESSVSTAVSSYIEYKVDELSKKKRYWGGLRDEVLSYLHSNANDTFLWVALVCQALASPKVRLRHTLSRLRGFPPGLDSLYSRMMDQIAMSEMSEDVELCRRVLAVMSVVYRPLALQELASLIESITDSANNHEALEELIKLCGSFLVLKEGIIFFVHQSAKDYLVKNAASRIFPLGTVAEHHAISLRSLESISGVLRRNIYDLDDWGLPVNQVRPPHPDPLAAVRYSCIYWAIHMAECQSDNQAQHGNLQDNGAVHKFIQGHYLHWLEALSILKSVPQGISGISRLNRLLLGKATKLEELMHDAYRFIRHSKPAIEISPLQVYASALLFSPSQSVIRKLFRDEKYPWITLEPDVEVQWSACLATFVGHSTAIVSVAFSSDGNRLVSGSWDNTVKVWDVETGACIMTLRGHQRNINSVAFSPDGSRIASGSSDNTVRIWDSTMGTCLTILNHEHWVASVAFSPDGIRLASGSWDGHVKIWGFETGSPLAAFEGHSNLINPVSFSPDGCRLASGSEDGTVKIWDVATRACLKTINSEVYVYSVTFSPDGTRLAFSSESSTEIWDTSTDAYLEITIGDRDKSYSVAFSPDGSQLATVSDNTTVKLWDATTATCLATFYGHSGRIDSLAFSPNGQLASGSSDKTIKIWDVTMSAESTFWGKHDSYIHHLVISDDGAYLASACPHTAKVWDTTTGRCLASFTEEYQTIKDIKFTREGDGLNISLYYNDYKQFVPLPPRLPKIAPRPPNDSRLEEPDYEAEWIKCDGKNVIWLPSEYRPYCSTMRAQTIVVGCRSGRFWMLNFCFP
ncbi:quinon protein alcohol dehydrogenase-like superfamily [Daldinia vernicosa]|uniref:quinon protein alcohol dehydrogenase-like superfamily n=1 Tax=Daldinia vernicosa TaxID=114800 RepID=UPI0020088DCA|nr:quinon protein alcohol dehydrogenase-like superfamily [Daldinia vernicosa]KAI0850603.1 quinon protein alcohol dehydrogenase-like superfamily [Daldinia vernicosa]